MNKTESIPNLSSGLKALNLILSEEQISQIETYLAQLTKWNRSFNLTAIIQPQKMLTHHVLDSLAIGPFFEKTMWP